MFYRRFTGMVLPYVLVGFTASLTWAQAGSLAWRVPNDANTMVILNVDKIMASPIAQKEQWRETRERAAAGGLTILPPSASNFLMAAKLDLEFMQPIWEVAVAKVKYEPSMPQVAAKWGGTIDRVAGKSAVLLPGDFYVVQLGPSTVASRRPANRQTVTRWLRQTSTTSGHNLSPYMKKAVAYSDKLGTPIIMAMDLEGIASADTLKQRLAEFESVKGTGADVAALAKTLASIEGITLGLNFKDDISGAMIIDFAGDTAPLKNLAKPILLEILGEQGAMIDEFSDWTAKVEPKRVRVGGKMYASGMRRLMSILDAPAALQQAAMPSAEKDDPQKAVILATQQSFQSVTGLLDDLRDKRDDAKTSGQSGIWWAKYADKIDKLPMLNVDEEMLDYRTYISGSLREGSTALRDVGGRTRIQQMNAPAQYRTASRWGSVGWYGGYQTAAVESPRLEAKNRARIATQERARGARSARVIMNDLNNATAQIRRKMTEKYKAEF